MRQIPNYPTGTVLRARHKGQVFEAVVLEPSGLAGEVFLAEYNGQEYRSLSAMGTAVTGGACNGWRFWKANGDESVAVPSRSVARRLAVQRGQPRPDFAHEQQIVNADELPDAFRVHDGYVPEKPDERGAYPTCNPKLGPRPGWFKDDPHFYLLQCAGCDLLVVAATRRKGSFDDYDGDAPHECTHRKPGESVDDAQRRLTHTWFLQRDAVAARKARGDAPPLVEDEDGGGVVSETSSPEESEEEDE